MASADRAAATRARPAPGERDSLQGYLRDLLPAGERLILVSNRGPLTFRRRGERWRVARGPGGLVTALGELGRLVPVRWVCAAMDEGGQAAAQSLAEDGPAAVQLREAMATELSGQEIELEPVALPRAAYEAAYSIVANPFLWFVQHQLHALPYEPLVDRHFLAAWRDGYRVTNAAMAEAALRHAGRQPVVMLQDYHLYLAAETIRARRPESLVTHFTHIPWPGPSTWQMLPQALRREICEGLLANDVVGLQTDRYAQNFLASVASFVRDARVDPDGRNVRWRGRTIWVRAYPISVDPQTVLRRAAGPRSTARRTALRARLERAGWPQLIVRVDRLEPSKNGLRGFLAFEELLARRPELRGRVRFLAIQSMTRAALPEYAGYAAAVREVVARVNGFADPDLQPIWLLDGTDYDLALAALQLADVVLVNPLVDGMNLVAKEAALVGDAVLVLSETAGAAEQLAADALVVAAADVAGTSRALEAGLAMPAEERGRRARRLRARVRAEDIGWWLERQLRDLAAVRRGGRPPSRALRDSVRRFDPDLEG